MSDTPTDSSETATTPKPSNWLHWWTNLSSNKQDRIIALTPLLAVIIFFIVIMLTFWYLNNEERERELVTTRQSAETIQQQIRLRLIGNEDSLQSMATDISRTRDKAAALTDLAPVFMADHPEIIALYWHDLNAGQIYSYHLFRKVVSISMPQAFPLCSRTHRPPLPSYACRSFTVRLKYYPLIPLPQ